MTLRANSCSPGNVPFSLFRGMLFLCVCLLLFVGGFRAFVSAQSQEENNPEADMESPAPEPDETPQVTDAQRRAEVRQRLETLVRERREELTTMTPEERRRKLEEERKEAAEKRLREREERERLHRQHEATKAQRAAELALQKGEAAKRAPLAFTGISCVLQVRPFHQSVMPGQRFATEIVLYSENAFEFDRLEIRLSYSHTDVRPLRVFDYPLADVLDPENPPVYSPGNGLLSYSVALKEPIQALETATLLYILWEATADNSRSELSLGRYGQPNSLNSAVYRGKTNLLIPKTLVGVSCVNADITIEPAMKTQGRAALLTVPSPARSAWDEGKETVRLILEKPATRPAPGEEFLMEVFLENLSHAAFDRVRLAIRFDPRKVEVLDSDAGGWIRRGINVSDVHAHSYFPFNQHNTNTVSNSLGRISYDMGCSILRPMPSGSLIRIRCLARASDAAESFYLFLGRENPNWFTDVRAGNRSLLERDNASPYQAAVVSLSE